MGIGVLSVLAATVIVLVVPAPALPVAAVGIVAALVRIAQSPDVVSRVLQTLDVPLLVGLLGMAVALGADQLEWLRKDLAGRPSSTPIVVFAHIPLWTVYADWGWGTDDAAQALTCLKPFGSVTVLNGHIHHITRKVEGNIAFHTARSTAFPQPVGGTAPSPGPLKVPAEQLHSMLGITSATFVRGHEPIALVDATLVVIPVTVTDPTNRFVLGLEKEDFTILEDGVQQKITHDAFNRSRQRIDRHPHRSSRTRAHRL